MRQSKPFQAVLFDVDGTLLDTTEFILQAYEHTLSAVQHELPDVRARIRERFGKPLIECYRDLLPDHDAAALCEVHNRWQAENIHLVRPFPTVTQTLRRLKARGVKIGAVTNRLKDSTAAILSRSGIHEELEVVISFEDVSFPKPHPEGIHKALADFNLGPGEAVMVGDSEFDIMAGKAAGVATIGVRTGLHPEKMEAAAPDYVVDLMIEIDEIIG